MGRNRITPQQAQHAHKVLEELARGGDRNAIVATDADFFPFYMVFLARAEATVMPHTDGMCLSRDEVDRFLQNHFDWPIKVRIARHIGNCARCYRYFLDVEGKTFHLPDEQGGEDENTDA